MRYILVIIFVFGSNLLFGQHWTRLDNGIVYTMFPNYVYSDDQDLIYHGLFPFDGDGDSLNGIAKWDGFQFTALGKGVGFGNGATPICSGMARYKGKLYASGLFNTNDQVFMATYNEILNKWEHIDSTGSFDGYLSILDDKLILHGSTETCRGQHSSGICAFDGQTWSPLLNLPDDNFAFHHIKSIIKYQNKTYIGGNFYLPDANMIMIDDLAILDNNQITSFGGGFHSGVSDGVDKMIIYKDELYMIGGFNKAAGDADNRIVRWDGLNFKEVGGGADAFIGDIVVHNNMLIAVGAFDNIGGVYSPRIAYWDGEQWHAMTGGESFDTPSKWIFEATVFKNELYIVGFFNALDGLTFRNVAKYNHVLPGDENNFNIFANNISDELIVNFEDDNEYNLFINVFSVNGQHVTEFHQLNLQGYTHQQISMANWANGVYIVTAIGANKTVTKKIVKAS